MVQNRKLRAGNLTGNSRGEREEQPCSLDVDGAAQRLASPSHAQQHSDVAVSLSIADTERENARGRWAHSTGRDSHV